MTDICRRPLRNNTKLQKCVLIVKKFEPEEVDGWEHIWRFNHTGSAITSFKETGMVYGYPVRADIKEGEAYDSPLYTPTTKEENGHDKPLARDEIARRHTKHMERTRKIAVAIRKYFEENGIVAADLKLECSIELAGIIYMLDKFGPDEFRAWDEKDRLLAIKEHRAPKSMDKEILRKWGKGVITHFPGADYRRIIGINNLDPSDPEHITFVHNQIVPKDVIDATVAAYYEIFSRLNDGKSLEDFQREVMGIVV